MYSTAVSNIQMTHHLTNYNAVCYVNFSNDLIMSSDWKVTENVSR